MTAETLVLPSVAPSTPIPRARGWFRQLGVDTGYVLASFPIAIAAFVVVVTGLSLGVGLLIIWVGVAVLAATLLAARGFATVERAWLPAVLRRPLPAAGVPAGGGPPGPQADHPAARPAVVARRAARDRPLPLRDPVVRRRGHLLVGRARRPHLRRLGLGAARRFGGQQGPARADGLRPHLRGGGRLLHAHRARLRRPPAVRRPRRRRCCRPPSAAGCSPPARPRRPSSAGSPRAATPPSPPRRSPCAGWSATSTTARSSGWSG